jgi:hypothetical protein
MEGGRTGPDAGLEDGVGTVHGVLNILRTGSIDSAQSDNL